MDEFIDNESQGFDQLIKDLMDTKMMADSGSNIKFTDKSEQPRYTEALHRQVFKITPAPLIKKKTVRFKNDNGSDLGSFLEVEDEDHQKHMRKDSRTIVEKNFDKLLLWL